MTPLLYCHAPLVLNLCYPLWEGNCSQDTIGELCTTHHGVHMSILGECHTTLDQCEVRSFCCELCFHLSLVGKLKTKVAVESSFRYADSRWL